MKQRAVRTLAATASALALAGGGAAAVTATAATATAASGGTNAASTVKLLAHSGLLGYGPLFIHHVSAYDPPTNSQCQATLQINCYDPAQVQQAYNLQALYSKGITGRGRTIALIDSFGSPTINDDLSQFDSSLSLPTPSVKIISPAGRVSAYDPSNPDMVGWAGETTLDVEWAHAAAPGANILLVEVPGENPGQMLQAEQYVINHHLADVISQSFGWTEQMLGSRFVNAAHSVFSSAAKHHITVLASAGDTGAANASGNGNDFYTYATSSWPATDPLVTAVGGTELDLSASGSRVGKDTVWNDTYNKATNNLVFGDDGPNPLATGGGKSAYFGRPSYQNRVKTVTSGRRGIPDISMSGSCSAAVNVYQSFGGAQPGWYAVCGTSESAPLFAGVVALAVQKAGHDLGAINPALYRLSAEHAKGLVTVTRGNNTVSFNQENKNYTVHGYYARNGYSLVSGVGTINAYYFVPELAKALSHNGIGATR